MSKHDITDSQTNWLLNHAAMAVLENLRIASALQDRDDGSVLLHEDDIDNLCEMIRNMPQKDDIKCLLKR